MFLNDCSSVSELEWIFLYGPFLNFCHLIEWNVSTADDIIFIYRSLWDRLQGLWQSNWRYSSPKADPVRVDWRRCADVHFEGNCIAETTSEIQPSKCCQVSSMAMFSLSEKEYIGKSHTIKHIETYWIIFCSFFFYNYFYQFLEIWILHD